ncbi:MAG TPA: DUF799 domain-containing protein [Bordetella sp.]|uniref:DUF799 domain-containing protein n=1 Tax=Bordetella sp. TaxID=28081 RepID=UPI002ED35737
MMRRALMVVTAACAALLLAGCVAPVKDLDYTAFKASRPRSILVLPPLNESPDIKATYGVLSQVTVPLAESGYYVLPVALVDETFKQNGLTQAADIQQLPPQKLREIFGADTALYIDVSKYGTQYILLQSQTVVSVSAKLIDLKTGDTLWTGTASAVDQNNSSGGGLLGMLLSAIVKQIVDTATDHAYGIAGAADAMLLSAGHHNSILYGPRSPKYQSD